MYTILEEDTEEFSPLIINLWTSEKKAKWIQRLFWDKASKNFFTILFSWINEEKN